MYNTSHLLPCFILSLRYIGFSIHREIFLMLKTSFLSSKGDPHIRDIERIHRDKENIVIIKTIRKCYCGLLTKIVIKGGWWS